MRWRSRVALGFAFLAASCGDPVSSGPSPRFLDPVSGDKQSGAVGSAIAAPLVLRVRDVSGDPIPGVRVVFRVEGGGATLAPSTALTDNNGEASTVVTPTSAGNVLVTAVVSSSKLSITYLLSASGASATPTCTTLVGAQIVTNLGGDGVCVKAGSTLETFMLVAFNSDLTVAATSPLRVTGSGIVPPQFLRAANSIEAVRTTAFGAEFRDPIDVHPSIPYPPRAMIVDTVGQRRAFNVNVTDSCAAPLSRKARIVAVTAAAVVAADTANPAGGFSDAEYLALGKLYDSLVSPAVTQNFGNPADIDANQRVVLLFTRAVNALPPDSFGNPDTRTLRRDLQLACAGSNGAELIYFAVPDSLGALGAARTRVSVVDAFPRLAGHELQHVINASRRLHVNGSTSFEERWLEEGLSQIAEELVFYRAASRASSENIGYYDLTLTSQSATAFQKIQRQNILNYRAMLAGMPGVFALTGPDDPATRGLVWSLLRYLVDQREEANYASWTRLANMTSSGVSTLREAFGPRLPLLMRDWGTAIMIDDLFEPARQYRQPSWNFRSILPYMPAYAFNDLFPLPAGTPVVIGLPAAQTAYFGFSVPAGASATVTWGAPGGGAIAPGLLWTLVRTR